MNYRENKSTSQLRRYIDLSSALYGVAKGPQPQNISEYRHLLEDTYKFDTYRNPTESELTHQLLALIEQSLNLYPNVSWAPDSHLFLDRALVSIASFADDHNGSIPIEFFPPIELHQSFTDKIEQDYCQQGKRLNLVDQFSIALELTNQSPISASILCHSAIRRLARDADKSKYGSTGLEDRVKFAEKIAYFEANMEPTIDSLGDTYHFWAKFIAGYLSHELRYQHPVSNHVYNLIYHYSPDMMKFIRNYIFGHKLEFNTKKKIDHMGFRVGLEISKNVELLRNMQTNGLMLDSIN